MKQITLFSLFFIIYCSNIFASPILNLTNISKRPLVINYRIKRTCNWETIHNFINSLKIELSKIDLLSIEYCDPDKFTDKIESRLHLDLEKLKEKDENKEINFYIDLIVDGEITKWNNYGFGKLYWDQGFEIRKLKLFTEDEYKKNKGEG